MNHFSNRKKFNLTKNAYINKLKIKCQQIEKKDMAVKNPQTDTVATVVKNRKLVSNKKYHSDFTSDIINNNTYDTSKNIY